MMNFLGQENKANKQKLPFESTKTGIAVNTVLGLPKAAVQVAKDMGQGILRNIASTGLTIASKFGGEDEMAAENIKSLFGQELWKNAFGDEPITSIERRIVAAEQKLKTNDVAKRMGLDKYATPLAFAGIMGSVGLDLTPFGSLEKNAVKAILESQADNVALTIAKNLGADDTIAKQLAPIFVATKTEKEARQALEVANSLIKTKNLAQKEVAKVADNVVDNVEAPIANELASSPEKSLIEEARKYNNVDEFMKTKGLDPDSVNIVDGEKFIVEATSGNKAILTELPITLFGKPKFETLNQSKYTAGRKITDPIEVTIYNGKLRISDGANRFTQAVANGDETIPVILENFDGSIPTKDQLTNLYSKTTQNKSLVEEARKYKSAEEFVKAQGETLYHGTTAKGVEGISKDGFQIQKGRESFNQSTGISVSADTKSASRFTGKDGNVLEVYLKPDAKLFDGDDFKSLVKKEYSGNQLRGEIIAEDKVVKRLKSEGYDGVDYRGRNASESFEQEVRVWNTDKLQTKSQLIDIWNKATQKTTPNTGKMTKREFEVKQAENYIDQKIESRKGKIDSREYDEGYFTRKPVKLSPELEERQIALEIQKQAIADSPYNQLTKYASKSGDFKGQLKEVTGTGKSEFGKRGDDIITEITGATDSEVARAEYEKFVARKMEIKEQEELLKAEIKEFTKQSKAVKEGGVLEKTKSPAVRLAESEPVSISLGEVESLQKVAQESLSKATQVNDLGALSLPRSIEVSATPVKNKVHLIDYIRTPDRVLKKIGLGKEADYLRTQYDKYIKELPDNIDKITQWSKEVPAESNSKIFKWLDGENIKLNPQEQKVAKEIKSWLSEWANRLGLPKTERIANYITHLFDDQLIKKEFDEDLAKIIADKIPSSVYDPFLQKRLGARGYLQDTWKALDAYVKRATRKVHLDPALSKIEEKASSFEKSQWDFVKSYTDRVNMRPTDIDNLLDNGLKNVIGYKFGQRPTAAITRTLRQMTYRAMLGLNVSSALKNLSQGVNTYAKLGERYTLTGYSKLLSSGARAELVREGVLAEHFIQDRALSATKKALEKADKVLFFFFENAEKINRGAAYFGAKAKAISQGKSELEAIKEAKQLVRDTQFAFGSIDTPIVLQSDIGKTLGQFQSFTVKQIEFLTEMAKNKEYAGMMRYAIAGMAFVYTIGQAFGMEPKELIPAWRIGTPPSLKLPVETGKAIMDTPNKYGKQRDLGEKARDIGKAALGLVPAGTQIKKTVQGIDAVRKGESQNRSGNTQFKVGGTPLKDAQAIIFGKYASPEAKEYFNPKKKKSKKSMSF